MCLSLWCKVSLFAFLSVDDDVGESLLETVCDVEGHQMVFKARSWKTSSFSTEFIFPLIEGLHELNVLVWNNSTLTSDDFIGIEKTQQHKVFLKVWKTLLGLFKPKLAGISFFRNQPQPSSICANDSKPSTSSAFILYTAFYFLPTTISFRNNRSFAPEYTIDNLLYV
ncbi:hypothetical protein RJT34_24420 [Clitoria ternatea]|uniref:Uncharacterized protein n=1 Tax=Clitoria ternatea TaxID=43366 RepID=A0AAN9IJ76_CLITE